ncbi:MAG: hypothetical protein BVN28_04895 [Nitrospira sp. ST-bin4]|nr:MAG: hypothetical protein BVN28_04895 [Nitrospira sp. ST-bin4]
MAMVKSALFIPNEDDLVCLGRIHGQARVFQQRFEQEVLNRVLNRVLIVADDGNAVCIASDYGDVEFKFECFSLKVFPSTLDSWNATSEICQFGNWHSIKCLFRFEYLRPATSGEIPSSWEQIVQKRGKQSEVSGDATAIGCALVGIVFWNSVSRCPAMLVANDDNADDPTALQVRQEQKTIELFMSTCEVVNLEEVPSWTREVRAWLKAR